MILNKEKRRAKERKATIDWESILHSWQVYLDRAGDLWRQAFIPLIRGLITDQGNSLNVAFGMTFDVRNLFAEAWFEDYVMEFAQAVVETTRDTLNTIHRQALEEGWGIPTTQDHLEDVFRQWMQGDLSPEEFEWFEERMPRYRTEMIARTETIRASNKGSDALYQAWGVEYKEWWTTFDERTCPWCKEMHGKRYTSGATIHDKGTVMNVQIRRGNEFVTRTLKFDYEAISGPPLHPNCRCTLLPWKEEWAEEVAPEEELIDGWLPSNAVDSVNTAIEECQRYGIKHKREMMYVIDRDGEVTNVFMGEEDWLDSTPMLDVVGDIIAVHNHPGSSSFSDNDIATLLWDELEHLIVVGDDGTIFRVSERADTLFPGGPLATWKQIQREVHAIYMDAYRELVGKFRAPVELGLMSKDEAFQELTHLIMKEVASYFNLDYVMRKPA